MSELLTTYTVKGRNIPVYWEFKYDLNGVLKEFNVKDGSEFSDKLKTWLFNPKRFPINEGLINSWKGIRNLEVSIGAPDISFDSFWNTYNYKVGKIKAQTVWKKLNETEKLKAIKSIKSYNTYLKRKGIEKVYPERFIKNKRFNDEFNSIH